MLSATDDVLIEQDFDPSLPEVNGDAAALERVFLNLIRNAREAIEAAHGDGPFDVRRRPRAEAAQDPPNPLTPSANRQPRGTIRLRTAMENQFRVSAHGKRRQFLRVEVSDTGRGISAADLQQLFTPFYTTKPSGTGLGLVLSQRIVALHGGKLWAERGSMLPRGAVRPSRTTPAATSPMNRLGDGCRQPDPKPRKSQPRGMTFCVMLPVGPD